MFRGPVLKVMKNLLHFQVQCRALAPFFVVVNYSSAGTVTNRCVTQTPENNIAVVLLQRTVTGIGMIQVHTLLVHVPSHQTSKGIHPYLHSRAGIQNDFAYRTGTVLWVAAMMISHNTK